MSEERLPPIHPGLILAEDLADMAIFPDQLARDLGVSLQEIASVVDGQQSIGADMALRLARYFGTAPRYWMNLQADYDLALAEQDHGDRIAQDVRPRTAA